MKDLKTIRGETLLELAGKVARELGGSVKPPLDAGDANRWLDLTLQDDGAAVSLHFDEWKARINVSGRYPRSKDGNTFTPWRTRPSITVSATRPAPAIAAEIKRRLLPDYFASYAEQLAIANKHDADEVRALAAADTIARLEGQTPYSMREGPYNRGPSYHIHNTISEPVSTTYEIRGDGYAEIKIRTNPEAAVELARAIQEVERRLAATEERMAA